VMTTLCSIRLCASLDVVLMHSCMISRAASDRSECCLATSIRMGMPRPIEGSTMRCCRTAGKSASPRYSSVDLTFDAVVQVVFWEDAGRVSPKYLFEDTRNRFIEVFGRAFG